MKYRLALFLAILPFCLWAQYPKEVMPGKTMTLTPGSDTLWVIKNSQFNNAIKAGERLKICNEIKDSLHAEVSKQQEKIIQKDSIAKDLREGYDRYKTKWEESDKTLEATQLKLEKQKRLTKTVGMVAAIGSAIITAILFIVL